MADEFVHSSVGTSMTQVEFEAVGLHVFNNQATGDLLYASSASQLSRLAIGATDTILSVQGGIPTWRTPANILTDLSGQAGAAFNWNAQNLSNVGCIYIGDTSDANITLGLVINQGANDDGILSLKSSDVAHGITSYAETDTYVLLKKYDADYGGLLMFGLTEDKVGFLLMGVVTNVDATRSTAAVAPFMLDGRKKSGTTGASLGADQNIVVIRDYSTTRFIFDTDGSAHADVEWVAYAHEDDISLITAIESELLKTENKPKTQRRHTLEQLGIIGKDSWHFENGKPRAMINMTKLSMLHHGALLQVYDKINILESKNAELEHKLKLLEGNE